MCLPISLKFRWIMQINVHEKFLKSWKFFRSVWRWYQRGVHVSPPVGQREQIFDRAHLLTEAKHIALRYVDIFHILVFSLNILIFSIFDEVHLLLEAKHVGLEWFFISNQTYTALRYVDILQIVNIFNISNFSIFQQPKIYLWQRPKMV